MKDLTIKGTTISREIMWAVLCFAVAFLTNVYAVIHYDRPAIELISQIGFVLVITLALYVALAVVRIVFNLMYRIFFPARYRKRKYRRTNYLH